jgi:hypothetical protein
MAQALFVGGKTHGNTAGEFVVHGLGQGAQERIGTFLSHACYQHAAVNAQQCACDIHQLLGALALPKNHFGLAATTFAIEIQTAMAQVQDRIAIPLPQTLLDGDVPVADGLKQGLHFLGIQGGGAGLAARF